MTRQQAVIDEMRVIVATYPMERVGAGDGWLRPFHVRYFRCDDTSDAVRGLTLSQVDAMMRGLARNGVLVKRDRRPEYRFPAVRTVLR